MLRIDTPEFDFDPVYLAFLSIHNGGKPIRRYFPVPGDDIASIDYFLNLSETRDRLTISLNAHQVWNLIEDRLLPGIFPIAALSGGDFVCMDYSDKRLSTVLLWQHEKSAQGNPSLLLIAPTFSTFLESLRSTFNPV